jgi:hypothetical protein
MKITIKVMGLAALALAIAAPALAQTSPSGGIGSLTPPAPQTPAPDQAQGPATGQPAPTSSPDDRGRPVQAPSSTSSQ